MVHKNHNKYEAVPSDKSAIPQTTPETITDQMEINSKQGEVVADLLARIKTLQEKRSMDVHLVILGLRKELEKNLTPEVVNEMLDEVIPALAKTKDADAARKTAQRGIEYKIMEGLHDTDTGKVKIETLKPVDGLQEDIHEKVNFLLEEIRIKEMNQAVRGLNHSAQSWERLESLLNQAIENGWIFKNAKGQLKSTIAYFDPGIENQPLEVLISDNDTRTQMFKKAYKKATYNLIDSFVMKKANLEKSAAEAAIKRQKLRRNSQIQKGSA